MLIRVDGLVFFPDREGEDQESDDTELNAAYYKKPVVPGRICEGVSHDERTYDRPYAPEAMQPAHMLGSVVQGDEVV